jgi:hypothetical protein
MLLLIQDENLVAAAHWKNTNDPILAHLKLLLQTFPKFYFSKNILLVNFNSK